MGDFQQSIKNELCSLWNLAIQDSELLKKKKHLKEYFENRDFRIDQALAAITELVEEVINTERVLPFSTDIPKTLEEYMEAVVKTREQLRAEQRNKLRGTR